ncbi:hypothetical protein P8452_38062 [Trifolium repens]|nr:hypothetical protein P8452_38062 [Trifolium repens]
MIHRKFDCIHISRLSSLFRSEALSFILFLKGPRWAKYYIGPLQFIICFGTIIGGPLVGGKSLKFIYQLYHPEGSMKLYQFIIICGVVTMLSFKRRVAETLFCKSGIIPEIQDVAKKYLELMGASERVGGQVEEAFRNLWLISWL